MSEERARYGDDFESEASTNRAVIELVRSLFELLEWLALLGALGYVAKTHNSQVLSVVQFIGFLAIVLYCATVFGSVVPLNLRRGKSHNVEFFLYLVGTSVGIGVSLLCAEVVGAIVKSGGLG